MEQRRHSVPAVLCMESRLRQLASHKQTVQFYTPQASSLTHHQKLNEFKDLINAPVKRERFRPSRRSSVPNIMAEQIATKESICKR